VLGEIDVLGDPREVLRFDKWMEDNSDEKDEVCTC